MVDDVAEAEEEEEEEKIDLSSTGRCRVIWSSI